MIDAPIVLLIAYIMPADVPDIRQYIEEPTIEKCLADAREFIERGLPRIAADHGAVAVMAGCRVNAAVEQDG